MRNFIALENIAHFKRRLETEVDPKTRDTLLRLIAEEEAKLSATDPRLSDEDDLAVLKSA